MRAVIQRVLQGKVEIGHIEGPDNVVCIILGVIYIDGFIIDLALYAKGDVGEEIIVPSHKDLGGITLLDIYHFEERCPVQLLGRTFTSHGRHRQKDDNGSRCRYATGPLEHCTDMSTI